jgi:hypothetical protein
VVREVLKIKTYIYDEYSSNMYVIVKILFLEKRSFVFITFFFHKITGGAKMQEVENHRSTRPTPKFGKPSSV